MALTIVFYTADCPFTEKCCLNHLTS